MFWLLCAAGSAFFAGITAILAKIGVRNINSTLATGIRTIVVLIFSWLMVFLAGSQGEITMISGKTLVFLILSGLATGASWLCYFKALQLGDASRVVPIDKFSVVISMVLAFVILKEAVTAKTVVGGILITFGTLVMVL